MKLKITLLFILIGITSFAQRNIFQDAKILNNHNDKILYPGSEVQKILDHYNIIYKINNDTILNLQEQPFLQHLKYTFNQDNLEVPNGLFPKEVGSGFNYESKINKLNVTNLANGMARFLADRAKQELNESFFLQMHKQMEKITELQVFFPASYSVLNNMNSDNIGLNIEHLRHKFNQDIQKLPANIYYTTQQSGHHSKHQQFNHLKTYFNEDKNGILISYALETILENQGKINPRKLIYNFAHGTAKENLEQKLVGKANLEDIKTIVNAIKFVELISSSLITQYADNSWISKNEMEELFTNDDLLKTYIGLILAQANSPKYEVKFYNSSLKQIIENEYTNNKIVNPSKLKNLKSLIKNIYQQYEEINEISEQLDFNKKEEIVDETYKFFNVLKENLIILDNQFLSPVLKTENNLELINNYISPAIDLSYNMYAKKYPQAIKDFSFILQKSTKSKSLENNKEYKRFVSKFSNYGKFIANVVVAQNSDEVKDAISASVLPVGSSRQKRYADWSVTLNAFVGGFAGKAFYKEFVGDVAVKKSINTFGITAPIGVTLSKGNLKTFNHNSALGLTIQIIDLGSLVNFYMKEGDGAQLPNNTKIELGDIIAPGALLSYSLGDTPLTIIGGMQYVPNLSRLENIPTNRDFKPLTWRVHLGIAVDIPLFNLKIWN